MTKAYIIEFAKSCNFEIDKEVKDLSGNTFFSLRHITTDKANKLMERFKNSK